jgi:hypothetical protein
MEGRGRTPEDRQAAAEARARAREGRPEPGDEEQLEGTGPRGAEGEVSRHYGGPDVYARRRLIAVGVVVIVVVLLILLIAGC